MQWYEWIGLISALVGLPGNAWAIYQIYERFSSKEESINFADYDTLLDERIALLEGLGKLLHRPNPTRVYADLYTEIREDPATAIKIARITGGFLSFVSILFLGVGIAPFGGIVWLYFEDPRSYALLSTFHFSFASLWVLSFSWVGLMVLGWALDQFRGGRLARRYIKYLERGGQPL
jgi:hypothetical protein